MSTIANKSLFISTTAGELPSAAELQANPDEALAKIARWCERMALGMEPGAPGESALTLVDGATAAGAAFSFGTITLTSAAAGTVFEVNGVPFTAVNGAATAGNNEFDISGADAADATSLAASINASTSAGVSGVVQACNLVGAVALASVVADEWVEINGVRLTAKASPIGNDQFSQAGSDTADGDSLAAIINAHPSLKNSVYATNSAGTVTLRQLSGTTGLSLVASAATFTLTAFAANATLIVSSLNRTSSANAITIKTLGIMASTTATCASVVATDTLVINGQALTAIVQRATGTLTCASAIAGDSCVVGGITFTGVAGSPTSLTTFSIDTSDTAAATSLKNAINAHPSLSGIVTATSAAGVVTVRAVDAGTAGNSIVLTGTAVRLAASGSGTLAGGIAVANNQFDVSPGSTNAQVATDLARAINASTTALINQHVRALARAAVVVVIAVNPGTIGNAVAISSTGGTITVAAARLAGATVAAAEGAQASATLTLASVVAATTVTINGVVFTADTSEAANQFDISGTDTQDAASLASVINKSVTAGAADVVATSSGAVVTVTARRGGVAGNAITVAASAGTVTIGGAAVSGKLGGGAAPTTVVPSAARLSGGVGGGGSAFTLQR